MTRLVLAHGLSYLVPLAVWWAAEETQSRWWISMAVAMGPGLAVAHLTLAATSVALCRSGEVPLGLTGGLFVLWGALGSLMEASPGSLISAVISAPFLMCVVLLASGFIGLAFPRQELTRESDRPPLPPWQFSLRQAFIVTTALACYLGALRCRFWTWQSADDAATGFVWSLVAIAAFVVLLFGTTAIVTVVGILPMWLTLRFRLPLLGAVFYTALATTMSAVGVAATGETEGIPFTVVAAGTYALAVTLTLWVVRRAGYRLVPLLPPEMRQ